MANKRVVVPKDRIVVGTVVQSKAGGPVMTVSRVAYMDPATADTHWFIGDELKSGSFRIAELRFIRN